MNYRLVIFDLDGTLVDSAPDLQIAVNRLLAEHGAQPLPLDQIRSMIGDGAAQLVARALAARSLNLPDQRAALQRFFEFYEADPTANTSMYEGVERTLRSLHAAGLPLAVCTNKPKNPANEILRRLRVADCFASVVGGDSHPFRKPDPRMLTGLLDSFDVEPHQALMVGDSEVDASTASAASVPFALMTYGYRRSAAADIPCLAALDGFGELLPMIGAAGKGAAGSGAAGKGARR